MGGGDPGPLGILLCLNLDTSNGSFRIVYILTILVFAVPSSSYNLGVYLMYVASSVPRDRTNLP
jgi:hypothetical protein